MNNLDKESRNKIVEKNIGLVYKVSSKYFKYADIDKESLIQEGCIGLIKAVENFDTSKEVKFSTYAYSCIEGSIKVYLRDKDERLPFRLRRDDYLILSKLNVSISKLSEKKQRKPDLKELSEYFNVSDKYLEKLLLLNNSISIDSEILDDVKENKSHICDVIKDTSMNEDTIIDKIIIQEALSKLSNEERCIIEKRYFQDITQKDISKTMSISQSKVCRIEKRALNNLKILLKEVV